MKRLTLTIVALAVVAAGTAAVLLLSDDSESVTAADTTVAAPPQPNTAIVARKDFVETTEIEGTLGFGTVSALPNLASGVVTWLPEPGTIVEIGDVLYEVNDVPVVYLPGSVPAYRALDTRADGNDVLQLETYLDSLGLMEPLNAAVDGDYTAFTGQAVEDWYSQVHGIEGLDTISAGFVMFGSDAFRISSVSVLLGQQVNGGSVLSITDTTRLVTVALDTALTGLFDVGDVVEVELPDGSIVDAAVEFVSAVAVTDGQGPQATSYLPVELTLDGDGSLFDESPVTIFVEEAIELGATVVPISALLALAEGGYAVEVMTDGLPVLTAVTLSNFLDNEVSIGGDIQPGDVVVVP